MAALDGTCAGGARRRSAVAQDSGGAHATPRAVADVRQHLHERIRDEEDPRGEAEGARRQVEVVLHLELRVAQVGAVDDVQHVPDPQDRQQPPAQPAEEGERRLGVALVAHDAVELAARRVVGPECQARREQRSMASSWSTATQVPALGCFQRTAAGLTAKTVAAVLVPA
eukprot:scaffold19101_cov53-Phaeocystis_antarctica.AAC.2